MHILQVHVGLEACPLAICGPATYLLNLAIYNAWPKPKSQAKSSPRKLGLTVGLHQGLGLDFDLKKPKPQALGQSFELASIWSSKIVFYGLESLNSP